MALLLRICLICTMAAGGAIVVLNAVGFRSLAIVPLCAILAVAFVVLVAELVRRGTHPSWFTTAGGAPPTGRGPA